MRKLMGVVGAGVLLGAGLSAAVSASPGDKPSLPVAMVLKASGIATVRQQGDPEAKPLKVLERLRAGAKLETGPDSQASLVFFSGERFEVRESTTAEVGTGELRVLKGSVKPLPPLPTLAVVAPIAPSEKAGSQSAAVRVRGGSQAFKLYPDESERVIAGSAKLTFTPARPASKYKVELESERGDTLMSVEIADTSLTVSQGILKPAEWYYWSVRTIETDKPSVRAEARFSTLGKKESDARAALEKEAASANDPGLLFLLAEVDRNLGLRREACNELKAIRDARGDSPELAEAWNSCGCPVP
jgi:hypothetical protein